MRRVPAKRARLRKQLQALGQATGAQANSLFMALPDEARAVVSLCLYLGRFHEANGLTLINRSDSRRIDRETDAEAAEDDLPPASRGWMGLHVYEGP